jgi:hypothetical protein
VPGNPIQQECAEAQFREHVATMQMQARNRTGRTERVDGTSFKESMAREEIKLRVARQAKQRQCLRAWKKRTLQPSTPNLATRWTA